MTPVPYLPPHLLIRCTPVPHELITMKGKKRDGESTVDSNTPKRSQKQQPPPFSYHGHRPQTSSSHTTYTSPSHSPSHLPTYLPTYLPTRNPRRSTLGTARKPDMRACTLVPRKTNKRPQRARYTPLARASLRDAR
ncbi:hypothetical protein BS50DRAFT_160049 [Corynespora cassiicola Philippines]|uniref:Uncharacterized protein n=1 Tax=Corynespora cassiicola Philippines TaxID=1448308 RepID=A0A2T2N6C4_CORCC|nr:hypothetical protein BS50DRAFT_160049 [Corynespora cassiicola Philippines]